MQLIAGAVLVAVSLLGLWVALPQDGEVRRFLQNDHIQSYYTIAIIGAFFTGLIFVILGCMELAG